VKPDYVYGRHSPRLHAGCGLVFGFGAGLMLSLWLFGFDGVTLAVAAAVAVATSISCGRWGERAWDWIAKNFPRWIP
jgi:hypothetical protein